MWLASFLPFIILACTGVAQDRREVGLELVLLADASPSIDEKELAFQRQGYATAMTDPRVIGAIENSAYGTIAVTYVDWAGNTAVMVDWTIIDGPESASAFAEALVKPPRLAFGNNRIGGPCSKANGSSRSTISAPLAQ